MKNNYFSALILFVGILTPLLLVLFFPNFYYRLDTGAPQTLPGGQDVYLNCLTCDPPPGGELPWASAWRAGWQDIYRSCPSCNYPFLGMVMTAGAMSPFADPSQAIFFWRLLLALFDGANVALLYFLLQKLGVSHPAFVAGGVGISFSSWSGSSIWGQIDGISQFLILLFLCLVAARQGARGKRLPYFLYLASLSSVAALLLLTKQLAFFSLSVLLLLLAADIFLRSQNWKQFFTYSAAAAGVFLALLAAVETVLNPPPGAATHLQHVLEVGGQYSGAGLLSVNGANLWVLSGRPMLSSPDLPLWGSSVLFSPGILGPALFLLFSGAALVYPLRAIQRNREAAGSQPGGISRRSISWFILYLALVNLAFNVFLPGTHERYLYHFFPFAIAGVLALQPGGDRFSENLLSGLFAAANAYGGFVLLSLAHISAFGRIPNQIIASVNIVLLVALLLFARRAAHTERDYVKTI